MVRITVDSFSSVQISNRLVLSGSESLERELSPLCLNTLSAAC